MATDLRTALLLRSEETYASKRRDGLVHAVDPEDCHRLVCRPRRAKVNYVLAGASADEKAGRRPCPKCLRILEAKTSPGGSFRTFLPPGWHDGLRCLSVYRPWPLFIGREGKRLENRESTLWVRKAIGRYVGIYSTVTADRSLGAAGSVGVTLVVKIHSAISDPSAISRLWPDPDEAALQRKYFCGPEALVLTDVWCLDKPVLPSEYGLTGMQLRGLWTPPPELVRAIVATPKTPAPSVAEVIRRESAK